MGRGRKFGKKWQNSGDVPLLIASSPLPERGGKKRVLPLPEEREGRRGKAGWGRVRAELEEISLEDQRSLSGTNAAGSSWLWSRCPHLFPLLES